MRRSNENPLLLLLLDIIRFSVLYDSLISKALVSFVSEWKKQFYTPVDSSINAKLKLQVIVSDSLRGRRSKG